MTAGTAGNETRRALYGKMAGDVPLRALLAGTITGSGRASIYYETVPSEANLPYVVFNKQDARPTRAFGPANVEPLENEIWQIQGVDRERDGTDSANVVDAIRRRLDILLTDGTISLSGGTALFLQRESDLDYAEVSDGVEYKHAASLFRLIYLQT